MSRAFKPPMTGGNWRPESREIGAWRQILSRGAGLGHIEVVFPSAFIERMSEEERLRRNVYRVDSDELRGARKRFGIGGEASPGATPETVDGAVEAPARAEPEEKPAPAPRPRASAPTSSRTSNVPRGIFGRK